MQSILVFATLTKVKVLIIFLALLTACSTTNTQYQQFSGKIMLRHSQEQATLRYTLLTSPTKSIIRFRTLLGTTYGKVEINEQQISIYGFEAEDFINRYKAAIQQIYTLVQGGAIIGANNIITNEHNQIISYQFKDYQVKYQSYLQNTPSKIKLTSNKDDLILLIKVEPEL